MPYCLSLLRLTSRISSSTRTSPRALSCSSTRRSATAISSGVPKTVIAPRRGVRDDGQGLAADAGLDQGLDVFGLGVLQVERAQHALVVGPALGRGLVDDDDRARVEDLVEEPVDEGEAVERVLERLVAQVHRDRLVAVLRVEEHVDPGQPAHRLQDLLQAGVLELDRDGRRALRRQHGQRPRPGLGPRLDRVELREPALLQVALRMRSWTMARSSAADLLAGS